MYFSRNLQEELTHLQLFNSQEIRTELTPHGTEWFRIKPTKVTIEVDGVSQIQELDPIPYGKYVMDKVLQAIQELSASGFLQ